MKKCNDIRAPRLHLTESCKLSRSPLKLNLLLVQANTRSERTLTITKTTVKSPVKANVRSHDFKERNKGLWALPLILSKIECCVPVVMPVLYGELRFNNDAPKEAPKDGRALPHNQLRRAYL